MAVCPVDQQCLGTHLSKLWHSGTYPLDVLAFRAFRSHIEGGMLVPTYTIPKLPPQAELETVPVLKALARTNRAPAELKGRGVIQLSSTE